MRRTVISPPIEKVEAVKAQSVIKRAPRRAALWRLTETD
jgi:hypothetical protein